MITKASHKSIAFLVSFLDREIEIMFNTETTSIIVIINPISVDKMA